MSALTIELNPPQGEGVKHGMQYSNWAYTDPAGIVTAAMRNLAGIQFDTFVCRGLSGILVAPLLARAMSKHFLIVRKLTEPSHSSCEVEGTFGHNWVFVDDFVSCGNTRRACYEAVQRMQGGSGTFVGTYEYQTRNKFSGATSASENGVYTPFTGGMI